MSTPVFFFPYHTIQDEYPKNSVATQYGSGYSFASAPVGPPQIMFHLFFDIMFWFTDTTPDGPIHRTYSPIKFPGMNVAALIDFYECHQLYGTFIYPHAARGNVLVRFNKPLVTPRNLKTPPGMFDSLWAHSVEPFQIDLILQPT
jgi:hypothetical protein